jgi:hypothetical protein
VDRRDVMLDPAVLSIVEGAAAPSHVKRVNKRRPRDVKRQQVNLKLQPGVVRIIKKIARAEGTSPAGVVDLLVVMGVRRYIADEVHFDEYTRPSRAPSQDWIVDMPDLDQLERGLSAFLERED